MKSMNLITVCTEAYPVLYAKILSNRIKKLSNIRFTHYCITDRPHEVESFAIPILKNPKSKGWWNKVDMFSPSMPAGINLYMDLDIVILKNFDEEINYCLANRKLISCVSDAIGWMGSKFSSSFMIFKTGELSFLHEIYSRDTESLQDFKGGDQVWVNKYLYKDNILYIDEFFPNLKKNFKFHLCKKNGNNLIMPKSIDNEIKMVDFGGPPKPHDVLSLDYVYNNWYIHGEVK